MLYCGRRHGKFESPIYGKQAVVFGHKKSEQSEPCTMNKVAAYTETPTVFASSSLI
jgi:hypothetical protein